MATYNVIWDDFAKDDLANIYWYIATQALAPAAAANLVKKIKCEGDALDTFPHYRVINKKKGLRRKVITKNYFILFTIDENKKLVTITQVMHARRNWRKLLR
jgi:plasmid stabilization system protein ParE